MKNVAKVVGATSSEGVSSPVILLVDRWTDKQENRDEFSSFAVFW